MKTCKRVFFMAALLGIVALSFSSCGFSKEAKTHYEAFITTMETSAKTTDISKDVVKKTIDLANPGAKVLKYQIVDGSPDQDVKKGTAAADLKKRFTMKKAK